MTAFLVRITSGLILAGVISLLAWRFRMLSSGGAAAAALLGAAVYGFGGLSWAVLLVGFFLSSSVLSRFRRSSKRGFSDKFSKGSRRDAWQVLANGGIAGLFALLNAFFPSSPFLWMGFAGSLAAVNADTWATELGVLNRKPPRLITTWQIVEKGESGGISSLGTLASLAGALFIALLAYFVSSFHFSDQSSVNALVFITVITIAGFAGSVLDSILGASLQAGYKCPQCNKRTEHSPLHTCGAATVLVSGLPWLNNDIVNVLCAASGSAAAIFFYMMLG